MTHELLFRLIEFGLGCVVGYCVRGLQIVIRESEQRRNRQGDASMPGVKSLRLQDIDRALNGIKTWCFGDEYELTLIARYTKTQYTDADVLVTNDDLEKVIAVIQKLKDRPPRAK